MNKIKFLSLSLMALLMACFTACENKYAVDHTAELVGTWTSLKPGYAEALTIKADGTVISTGYENGEYWENIEGKLVIKDDVATMTFEDGDIFKGHIDVVPGIAFTIYTEDGEHWTFNYCKEDLSDEVVGMWICTQTPSGKSEDMLIQNFQEDGTLITTGRVPEADDYIVNANSNYKVFGDLYIIYGKEEGTALVFKFNVSSNETTLGKMMTVTGFMQTENGVVEETSSWLRVEEGLNFTGQTYNYSAAYVSNAKGKNEDFTILGETFNMTNIAAGNFDVIFGSDLYSLVVSATSIKQKFRPNGEDAEIDAPITVDGNKVTLDMGAVNPALRKVDMYMFQSANDSQLHIYMPTASAVNYLANLEFVTLLTEGKINPADTAAVEKVFTDMAARIESINVSLVFKARN